MIKLWKKMFAVGCAASLVITTLGVTVMADEINGESISITSKDGEESAFDENKVALPAELDESEESVALEIDNPEITEIEQPDIMDYSGISNGVNNNEAELINNPMAADMELELSEENVGAGSQLAMWFMDDLKITCCPGEYAHNGTNNFDVVGVQNNSIKAPFDCTIVDILTGYNAGNTVIIQSINPVQYANGYQDYMSMAFAHDDDISDCYIGRIISQGEVFYQTGTYGVGTGRHSHVTCMSGKYTEHTRGLQRTGYYYNGEETWTFVNSVYPTDALFISPSTNVVDTRGLVFKACPDSTPRGEEMLEGYSRVLPDGDYQIVSAADISCYLDIVGADTPAASGENVTLCRAGGHIPSCDVWSLTYDNSGFYTILQKGTNISLDVAGADTAAWTNIMVSTFHGGTNQRWAISQFGDQRGYRIQSKVSGYSLDISNAEIENGTNIQQYVGNDSDAQRWIFIPYEPEKTIADGRYVLISALNPNLVLDVEGDTGNVRDGANVQVWNDGADSRYYSFDVQYLEYGYYRLIHAASGKSLEVKNSSIVNVENIQLSTSRDQYNQKWAIMRLDDGYVLVSRCSGLVMDVTNGLTNDGANVGQIYYNGSKATQWKFVPAEYKVTYNANGGSGAPSVQTKYYRKVLNLSSVKPTLSGKVFKGWATRSDATSANYKPGASYTADKDLTLYAVWETQKKQISSCTVTLSTTSYTYNGKAKKPSATVSNGTVTLTSGTDYTVSYSNNTNAGTATVTITGKGNYSGTKDVTFTINKAAAKLTFENSSVSKTTKDAAFTNALTKTTDGTVTFKSSNTSVATVNSTSGRVTIKSAGETTITATSAAGTNYKAGSASYTLTIKAPAATGFSDVQDPSHPYYKAIYWAADAGITKGYSDGTFGINRACTRSEAVMFLWRLAGKPEPVDALSSPFRDVPKTHAHYKAILWASQRGITKGYSDGTFGINKTCTRGQIMTFIWRFKGQPAPQAVSKSPFSDVPMKHAYYKAILWGAQNGVTNGYSDGTFGINKDCTRGQIVTFLYRIK